MRRFFFISILLLAGCTRYLSVQPQGEVIPTTDEEFAAIMHTRIREMEGGEDEYVIGNMDVLIRLEGCADRNFRLAVSNVSTNKSVHNLRTFHIGLHGFNCFLLSLCLLIRKCLLELRLP